MPIRLDIQCAKQWPTANRAIFNIVLISATDVYQKLDHLAAIGALARVDVEWFHIDKYRLCSYANACHAMPVNIVYA